MSRRRRHVFRVHHLRLQELLLRALEEMSDREETQTETGAINGMMVELQRLIEARKRRRRLPGEQRRREQRSLFVLMTPS